MTFYCQCALLTFNKVETPYHTSFVTDETLTTNLDVSVHISIAERNKRNSKGFPCWI